jgi:Amt family ammonium transporter
VAGALVVGSVMFFDRVKIDDPVGAISVHLICGIWGTLAVGIFSTNPEHSFFVQLLGVVCYGAFTFTSALGIFAALKRTMGIRVSEAEELEGLDLGEHGMHAYDLGAGPGWQEQSRGPTTHSLRVATPKLATSEND